MVKRLWIILILFCFLIFSVVIEQVYTDNTYNTITIQIGQLQQNIQEQNSEDSKGIINNLDNYWNNREIVLSLFVDYRDIEQIGRQLELIKSHLNNDDFELAIVECNLLSHIVDTYKNTIGFDWQNII